MIRRFSLQPTKQSKTLGTNWAVWCEITCGCGMLIRKVKVHYLEVISVPSWFEKFYDKVRDFRSIRLLTCVEEFQIDLMAS